MQPQSVAAAAPTVIDVTEATFDQEVVQRSYETPVVIDFWAPWCGPCRTLGPTLEKLANEARGAWVLAKVNVDNNPRLAQAFGVQGIPAVKAVSQGRLADEFVGALPESRVRAWLKGFVPEPNAAPVAEAAPTDPAQVVGQLRAALETNPDDAETRFELGRALLGQGDPEGATILQGIAEGTPLFARAQPLLPLGAFFALGEESAAEADGMWNTAHAYQMAARAARSGETEQALELLVAIVGRDRAFREDGARKTLLALFALLGEENSLVNKYRRKLANVLF